ncbi:esterase/lipase [Mycoplasmopsis californica HAZ160_1]|uniref:Esterase/lipase n=1 Tax=Mycoplasmopsis californica HAZ160_1 TaxID=1397850 RepID=A0AAT9F7A8_9BACT|nr:alpha/beta fold hydrolase [Mycoplasmopsis californica]BAP00771.1 esterase/lipase [Mycoplasmopsis californica HAZ160_1]BBG40625.1 esterase/lipase [Mycoplasmopsis californica]BBG41220.1 esterase/lipase [Mycoplasmopsis californica]BBG41813.1 esterase/lipase [Mycoplasmopsis californica]BBG42407.1 esterase/lipase [Mycoplasmopsis californica]
MIRKTIQLNTETISYLTDDELGNIIVLFLHGFGDEAQRALSLFNSKDRIYSIIAPDFPGCGQSSNNVVTPSIEYYCQIISEFVEKTLPNRKIYIVTHSLGTIPGLKTALSNPNIIHIFGVAPLMPRDENPETIALRTKWMLPSTAEEWYESQLRLFCDEDDDWITTPSVKNKILSTPKSFYSERSKRFSKLATQIFDMNLIKQIYSNFYSKQNNFTAFISKKDQYFDFSRAEKYINLYNVSTCELNDSGHAMFYKNTQKIHKYINNFIIKKEGLY